MPKPNVLTSPADDFPRWYQELLDKAELADSGPVRGTMVIRPYAFALWERIQSEIDARIKATGAENVYLPLLVPEGHLAREAEHVEGFSPELAVVTHAGGKQLTDPLVVRPTSETLFGEVMARWVQSHRDLPMLLNQWANVVRWELRPRTFLRTTEFLWQEGHTAHATAQDAADFARRIHLGVYRDFLESVLAIPIAVGVKTPNERFAGATSTLTCEAMMGDRKALQMATSHELGQNFARAFDITYTASDGRRETCWTTSWGSSTRLVGGLIMAHGDGRGLRLPPRIAPVQVAVIAVADDDATMAAANCLVRSIARAGVRVKLDARVERGFGRRSTEWELKGVPVRIEVGPRDVEREEVTIVRRNAEGKETASSRTIAEKLPAILEAIQAEMFNAASTYLHGRTADVGNADDAVEAAASGWARLPWSQLGPEGERRLNGDAVTVRCLQNPDGTLPAPGAPEEGLVAIVGRSY